MSSNSNIEWTESTWNPIAGCTPVSPGCLNCYAATMAYRLEKMGQQKYVGLTVKRNGVRTFNGKISLDDGALSIPLKRKKPTVFFVNSMADLFHEDVPFDFIDKVFAVMALCPQHTFQVLTKRPERMAEYLQLQTLNERCWAWKSYGNMVDGDAPVNYAAPLPNVWVGTSVENQSAADERIPHLLKCPAAIRFLSCEPLLGPIELHLGDMEVIDGESGFRRDGIHWIIVGGESGKGARRCDLAWIRSIVEQCKAAGVACFVKQLGAHIVATDLTHTSGRPELMPDEFWYRLHLRDKKGGDPSEWHESFRIRQLPTAPARSPR